MTDIKEIFVIKDRCMGCHTCELACATAHSKSGNLYEAMEESPRPVNRVYVEALSTGDPVPVLCRHCEDAPCMHACIAGAISKTGDHTVVTDTDKCIGCWTCVMVCPYGMVGRHPDMQKAYRCDRCPGLGQPACVSACPTRALVYRTVEEFSKDKRLHAAGELSAGQGG
jgi:carbon-monoxide dehydrogenase iron sulfur subunit